MSAAASSGGEPYPPTAGSWRRPSRDGGRVAFRSVGREAERERGEVLEARRGHPVVVLEPDPGTEFRPVERRFHRHHVPLLERLVPGGIEVRDLVDEQADAVAEVWELVTDVLDPEDVAALEARLDRPRG